MNNRCYKCGSDNPVKMRKLNLTVYKISNCKYLCDACFNIKYDNKQVKSPALDEIEKLTEHLNGVIDNFNNAPESEDEFFYMRQVGYVSCAKDVLRFIYDD